MQRYILRRLFQGIIVLFGISIIVFALVRLSGDPSMLMAGPGATVDGVVCQVCVTSHGYHNCIVSHS